MADHDPAVVDKSLTGMTNLGHAFCSISDGKIGKGMLR
jgi:hypothetical protein